MLPTRSPASCLARAIAISRTACSWPMTRREMAAAMAVGSGLAVAGMRQGTSGLDTDEHRAPVQARAQGGEGDQRACRSLARLLRLVEGDRQGRRGGVAVALDVVVHLLVGQAERLLRRLVDPQVGLVHDQQVEILDAVAAVA